MMSSVAKGVDMCLEGISLVYVVSRVDYDVTCVCRQPAGLTSVLLVVGTCGNCKIACMPDVWFTPTTKNWCIAFYTRASLIMRRCELIVTAARPSLPFCVPGV